MFAHVMDQQNVMVLPALTVFHRVIIELELYYPFQAPTIMAENMSATSYLAVSAECLQNQWDGLYNDLFYSQTWYTGGVSNSMNL